MSSLPLRFLLITSLTLTGCNAAGVQPGAAPEAAPADQETSHAPEPAADSEADEMLAGRITSMQEYLLQLKRQNGELQQQNQAMLLQLQAVKDVLNQLTLQADTAPEQASDIPSEQALQGLLDQLGDMIANMNIQAQGSYQMTSAYTAQGQWIVIRYDQVSGDAWLADRGQWQVLQEQESLPVGDYEISLLRADQDKKGYVALRLDRVSGATWWLNQDSWQSYAE